MRLIFPDSKLITPALALITGLILFSSALPAARAHSLYIQSTRYTADQGKAFPLFFCYGHYVPVADGVRGKKLNKVNILAPNGTVTPVGIRNETGLHSYMVDYNTPGIWTLTAETTPGYYTVYTDKKGRERHTIKPMAKIKDRASEVLKSYYSKQYAKTYVRCEDAPGMMPSPAGLALELVPVNNIFNLKPGENLELDILLDGKPYAGEGTWDATYMGFSTASEDNFYPQAPIKGSRLSIPVPNTGRWFVRYFIKKDASEADRDKYLQMKLTATLTFQLDNAPRHPKEEKH